VTIASQRENAIEWIEHYGAGRFGLAVEEAEKTGIDNLIGKLGSGDLWRLADAARAAGRHGLAARVLLGYRERFPGEHRARTAVFLLGRSAVEQRGDHREAIRWFETYLAESPGGPLAREALGRLMDSYTRVGMTRKARSIAEKYLNDYPEGPSANQARSLADK